MSRDRFFVFILPLFIPFSVAITSVYYGVCVGINDYPGTINDLLYCVADAEEMKRAFVNEQGWNSNNIELLTDGSASEYAIQNKIQNMPKNENNYNLFFYAGHGDSEELGGWDGIIPANSINARITPLELQSWFGSSYQFCCYLDACGTGIFANDMSHGVISSACKADETADEGLDGHGYFTYYLLSGLANNAADPDGIVSAEELHDYAAPRVTSYNSSQHPQLGDNFDGYLNFRSLDPPVITECWSDPNANPYNYRETNRAKLTFSRPNGCDNFILYWEFNNGEEKRKKQFDINTVPLNKELEVDWYRTVNCDVRDDEFGGPDARCEHYELWIEFEGINVSSDEITVRLHFEPFYSYPDVDEFVSFRVKAIDEWGQESDWSDACSCSIVDDPQRLTLVSPVGGEVWHEGTHQTIQWTSDNYDKQVKIFFSSGGDWVSIAGDSTENDGEFVWTTPGDISDSCRILVEGTPEGAPKDKSREFSIIPLPEDTTITQLVFATAEQTFDNVSVSSVMTVQSKNVSDELVPVMGRDVVLDLASTSPTGEFSLKARPFEPITSVTLKDGAYAVNFYYRDNSEGDYTITVSETPDRSWSDAQQAVHITDADRIEAENMTLNGMHIIDRAGASAGQAIQPGQPYGYAEYEFFGDMAQYKIIAGVLDEPDGHSEGLFKVNGATLDDWFFCDTPPDSEEAWRETEIGLASLQSGDVLSFRVYPDSSELGLVDYIKTVYVGEYSYAPQKLYCEFLALCDRCG